jgi:lysylphosphatidylglycerol synthetase-like protein (DUF2156 family)
VTQLPTFAAWVASAGAAALVVGAVRNHSDRAAWLLAILLLLGVVISRPDRLAAVSDFLAILSGQRAKPGVPGSR